MSGVANGIQFIPFLLAHRRLRPDLLVYIFAAVSTVCLYLYGLGRPLPYSAIVSDPLGFVRFAAVGVGNSVVGFFENRPLVMLDLAVGMALTLCYAFVLYMYLRLSADDQKKVSWLLCLVALGVGEDILIALGRFPFGVAYAASSRYATLTLISVAAALLFLAWRANSSRRCATAAITLGALVLVFTGLADMTRPVYRAIENIILRP